MNTRLQRGVWWRPVLFLSIAFLLPGSAAIAQTPPLATRSHSGQFVMVQGASTFRYSKVETNQFTIELSPVLLPVSCERIKQALLRELGAATPWQGKIFLSLRPATENDPGIFVVADRYQNAWQYSVELPTPVNRVLYVRAIVQALLLEIANRPALETSAEVPQWLIEGLTRQILSTSESEIILAPPSAGQASLPLTHVLVSKVKDSPLKYSHAVLQTGRPLTFDELCWPSEGMLSGPGADLFGASSHLFSSGLLQLQFGNGRLCMRNMLDRLHAHENWQLAFYEAFAAYFQRPLDVEKWWTLQTVHFTGRDITRSWDTAESEAKLLDALKVAVRTYSGTNSLPPTGSIPLQTALRQWEDPRQRLVLERKVRELEMLRLRVSTNMIGIVEDYRLLLADTLEARAKAGLPFGIRKRAAQASISERTARELDALDLRFAGMIKARTNSPVALQTTPQGLQ